MRRFIVIIGAALAVSGLILGVVPLFNGPSQVLTPSHSVAAFNATVPVSLTTDLAIGLSWTSNQHVSLLVVVCRSVNPNASSLDAVCPGESLTVLNGTSGSRTVSVPIGGTLLVGIVSPPSQGLRVNVQLKPAEAAVGALLAIGGAGIVVAGLLLRRRRGPPALGTPPSSDGPAD